MARDRFLGTTVIDIGCGAGRLTRELMLRGAGEVVGMDISEVALRLARALAVGLAGNPCFEQGDMESMPWPSERFDVAFGARRLSTYFTPTKAL